LEEARELDKHRAQAYWTRATELGARVFGIDTTQAFNDVVTGVGRASPQILDNLGIRIPDGFDKLTQGMSAAQKVSKLLELTLEAGGKEIESLGGLILSNADKFRQLTASVEDLNDELKAELSENLIPLVDFAKNTGVPGLFTHGLAGAVDVADHGGGFLGVFAVGV
jgi:hypothetical protein